MRSGSRERVYGIMYDIGYTDPLVHPARRRYDFSLVRCASLQKEMQDFTRSWVDDSDESVLVRAYKEIEGDVNIGDLARYLATTYGVQGLAQVGLQRARLVFVGPQRKNAERLMRKEGFTFV